MAVVGMKQAGVRRRGAIWGAVAVLVLLPLAVMAAVSDMDWRPAHAVFAAITIIGSGIVAEVALRSPSAKAWRRGLALAFGGVALTVWANGAVGIVGNEGNPWNLVYMGIAAIPLLGGAAALFRARPMVWVMTATALAQFAAFAVAWAGEGSFTGPITVFLCSIWLAAAALFRKAARAEG